MSTAKQTPLDPRIAALATDTSCPYRGHAMNKAIAMVIADPSLQTQFASLADASDYNRNGTIDTHEFAASLVALAEHPNLAQNPQAITGYGRSIYLNYEAEWRREHRGR